MEDTDFIQHFPKIEVYVSDIISCSILRISKCLFKNIKPFINIFNCLLFIFLEVFGIVCISDEELSKIKNDSSPCCQFHYTKVVCAKKFWSILSQCDVVHNCIGFKNNLKIIKKKILNLHFNSREDF